jgi:ADP-ribose pyrophosphatase YjhB (NUDIX family)
MTATKKPRIRVAGVLLRGDRILLIEHTKNQKTYCLLPGGGAESGETLEESVVREFSEELGMNVTVNELLLTAQTISPDKSRSIVHMFFRVESNDEPKSVTEEDGRVTGYRWQPTHSSLELPFYPDLYHKILELTLDDKYNGMKIHYPEWID